MGPLRDEQCLQGGRCRAAQEGPGLGARQAVRCAAACPHTHPSPPARRPRPRTLLPSSGLGGEYESISRPHPSPFLGECTSFPTPRPRTLSLAACHTSHTSHWPLASPLLVAGFKAYTALSPDEQGKHGWKCTLKKYIFRGFSRTWLASGLFYPPRKFHPAGSSRPLPLGGRSTLSSRGSADQRSPRVFLTERCGPSSPA